MKRQQVEYLNGSIYWFFNGEWHRDGDLPARYYFKDGKIYVVVYCQHGKCHRTTGPAIIDYVPKVKRYYYQYREYASLEELQMLEACR